MTRSYDEVCDLVRVAIGHILPAFGELPPDHLNMTPAVVAKAMSGDADATVDAAVFVLSEGYSGRRCSLDALSLADAFARNALVRGTSVDNMLAGAVCNIAAARHRVVGEPELADMRDGEALFRFETAADLGDHQAEQILTAIAQTISADAVAFACELRRNLKPCS